MVKGTLEVLLVESKGIKDRKVQLQGCLCGLNQCNKVKMRSYVVVQCGNQVRASDLANQEGKKLIWNKKLILKLESLEGEDEEYNKLVLKIMRKHKVSGEDSIGEATIYIKEVLSIGKEKGIAELDTQKYRVVLPNKTYSGEISVALRFTLDV